MSRNIRDRKAHSDSIWDWNRLNGCFPRGCRPMDVDGFITIHGRMTFFEGKREDKEVSAGQRISFNEITEAGHVVVLVSGHPPDDLESWYVWDGRASGSTWDSLRAYLMERYPGGGDWSNWGERE